MIVPIPYVLGGIGLITGLLSVPLVLRRVPMNHVYGVRIAKAFVSDRNWYEINAYGGRLLLVFGVFLVVFSVAAWPLAPSPNSAWAPVFLVLPLLAIVPVLLLIGRFARGLPDG
jgi:hypothetical protein